MPGEDNDWPTAAEARALLATVEEVEGRLLGSGFVDRGPLKGFSKRREFMARLRALKRSLRDYIADVDPDGVDRIS